MSDVYAVEVRGIYTQIVYIEADSPREAKRKASEDPWQFDWEPEPQLSTHPWPTRKTAKRHCP